MKQIGKKSLALLLTLAMAFSLLCITPLARGSADESGTDAGIQTLDVSNVYNVLWYYGSGHTTFCLALYDMEGNPIQTARTGSWNLTNPGDTYLSSYPVTNDTITFLTTYETDYTFQYMTVTDPNVGDPTAEANGYDGNPDGIADFGSADNPVTEIDLSFETESGSDTKTWIYDIKTADGESHRVKIYGNQNGGMQGSPTKWSPCFLQVNAYYEADKSSDTGSSGSTGDTGDSEVQTEGQIGDSVYYRYDAETHTLTIYGEGATYDYDWYNNPSPIDDLFVSEGLHHIVYHFVVEEGVTYLGTYLFADCSYAQDWTFPTTLEGIGDNAFYLCGGGLTLYFTGDAPTFGSAMFNSNGTITVYYPISADGWVDVIGQNYGAVTSYGDNVEWVYYGLEDANLNGSCGDSLYWILNPDTGMLTIYGTGEMYDYSNAQAPWYRYSNLITAVTVDNGGGVSLSNGAFSGCTGVKYLFFLGDPPEFGNNCFRNISAAAACSRSNELWTDDVKQNYGGSITWEELYICNLDETLYWELRNNVLRVFGEGAMDDFEFGITPWLDLPNTIPVQAVKILMEGGTSVGSYAFAEFLYLTTVEFAQGSEVTSIGEGAFFGCSNLTEITFPCMLEEIGNYAFDACTNLKTVVFTGSAPSFAPYCFLEVTATAWYPADDPSWTAAVMQDYGGNITWVPYTHEHSWSGVSWSWTETKDGAWDASASQTCSVCLATESLDTAVTSKIETNQTCAADGLLIYTATATDLDGKTVTAQKNIVLPATGEHDWQVDEKESTPATCTEEGVALSVCSVCGATQTETAPALGHNYVSETADFAWNVEGVSAAACTASFTCADCDNVAKVTCEVSLSEEESTAECTEPGTAVLQAAAALENPRDGKTVTAQSEYVLENVVLGHNWNDVIWGDWTENGDGTYEITASRTCTRCNEPDPDLQVSVYAEDVDPTCIDLAKTIYTAEAISGGDVVGTAESLTVEYEGTLTDHSYNSVVSPAPTCTEEGVRTYTCTVCGYWYTEAEPAMGHNLTYVEAVDATTQTAGSIGYWTCRRCGALFLDAEGLVPATEADIIIEPIQILDVANNIENMTVSAVPVGDVASDIFFELDIWDVNESVSSEEREAIAQAVAAIPDAAGMSAEYYFLEIDLFELLNDEVIQITDSDFSIEITVSIPEDLLDADEYFVVRLHGEENDAAVLEPYRDTENNTLTFISDQFSAYAIVALSTTDTAGDTDDEDIGNEGGTEDPDENEPDTDEDNTENENEDTSGAGNTETDTGTEIPTDENTGSTDGGNTGASGTGSTDQTASGTGNTESENTGTTENSGPAEDDDTVSSGGTAIEIKKSGSSVAVSSDESGGAEGDAGTSGGSDVSSGDDDSGKENPDTSDAQMPYLMLLLFVLSVAAFTTLFGVEIRKKTSRR